MGPLDWALSSPSSRRVSVQHPHGRRRTFRTTFTRYFVVSIHVPIRDAVAAQHGEDKPVKVSIHAPQHGMRRSAPIRQKRSEEFQSTHPARDALQHHTFTLIYREVSIHAPHMGCDDSAAVLKSIDEVSIHAPHTGCDVLAMADIKSTFSFNPRIPHGMRREAFINDDLGMLFQSTHPAGMRPDAIAKASINQSVSIHAPRTGCDGFDDDFPLPERVSIHAPHTGCDTLVY